MAAVVYSQTDKRKLFFLPEDRVCVQSVPTETFSPDTVTDHQINHSPWNKTIPTRRAPLHNHPGSYSNRAGSEQDFAMSAWVKLYHSLVAPRKALHARFSASPIQNIAPNDQMNMFTVTQ
ncbi:hypothetical protein OPQ81_003443 [Rhizoctonia solani]|nr:hypothetical protein OPQ81_003443 [Rhizoctonia solani]